MFVGSVQMINRLDSQSNFQMLTPVAIAPPTWRPHTGLCKFAQNILTDRSLGPRRDPKLREMTFLPISYNFTVS